MKKMIVLYLLTVVGFVWYIHSRQEQPTDPARILVADAPCAWAQANWRGLEGGRTDALTVGRARASADGADYFTFGEKQIGPDLYIVFLWRVCEDP